MKKILCVLSIMVISLLASMAAYAGEWREETGSDGAQWRYENNDGTFASAGWFWLDGNGDGTSECYYFDSDGLMLSDTVTPDGYQVNGDGAWIESGIVQTQVAPQPAQQTEGEESMIPMIISVSGSQFEANLLNNASTQALLAQMPLTITMSEMNGNEKYYYFSSSLPTDTGSVGNIRTGDLMLYGSDCLVLFYGDFRTSYRYTRLGAVTNPEGLSEALGRDSVQVTFERR